MISPIDPGEIRWASGSVRIGFLGDDRWRVDAVNELSTSALIEHLMRALESGPRGAPVPIAGAPNAVARDLGIVSLRAPRDHKQVRVAWREDLVGVLRPDLPLVDVVASVVDGVERRYHAPLVEYARNWLWFRAERCRAVGVPLPPDRLGDELAASSFESSPDRAALAARLEAVLNARIAASDAPARTFHQAMRELDALGHECTFADTDGKWVMWASHHWVASFHPSEDGRGTCRVELDTSVSW